MKPSAGSLAALEAAMSHASGVWSFPPPTERKLSAAVAASNHVIVLFSVSGSGAFQGCALFSGQTATEGSRSGVSVILALKTECAKMHKDWGKKMDFNRFCMLPSLVYFGELRAQLYGSQLISGAT